MTFLELAKKVRQECGIQGEGKPASVDSQIGLLNRVIGWTRDADLFIQSMHVDWDFHWKVARIDTTVNSDELLRPADLKTWERKSFAVDRGTVNGRSIQYEDIDVWRLNNNLKIQGSPSAVSINPKGNLKLGCPADDIYEIYGEYWVHPVPLITNDQFPLYAPEFHRAIIEKAKMYFFEDVESNGQWQQAQTAFMIWMVKLENQYLPSQQQSDLTSPMNHVVRPV